MSPFSRDFSSPSKLDFSSLNDDDVLVAVEFFTVEEDVV